MHRPALDGRENLDWQAAWWTLNFLGFNSASILTDCVTASCLSLLTSRSKSVKISITLVIMRIKLVNMCIHAKSPQPYPTLCDLIDWAHQAPLSMGFFRQEYWSGLPCPLPGDLPNPGTEPVGLTSPALAGRFFTTSDTWEALVSMLKIVLHVGKVVSVFTVNSTPCTRMAWAKSNRCKWVASPREANRRPC